MREAPDLSFPTLSIIIPIRNAREAWKKTWASLCQLDAPEDGLEVVVVDGESSDGTWDDLQALQLRQQKADPSHSPASTPPSSTSPTGPRLVLLRRPPRGIYDAMNQGATVARGSWWTFMGAGECIDPAFDWLHWREQATEDVIQIFRVDLLPPLEPGVPGTYPARWDRSLRWRHTTHHQGIWYPANLLPTPPYDVRFRVLADYDLHLHLFQTGIPAQCWPLRWVSVAPGGISRNFDSSLYREEMALKWRRLPLFQAVFVSPLILLKWFYKKSLRWASTGR